MPSITRLQAWACRAPIEVPVATSFGIMRNRPAVFLRVEDSEGAFGWGEVFANWPAAGAEHRVNLLADDLAGLVLGTDPEDPRSLWADLTSRVRVRAHQCGEPGPFAQALAGLDQAFWDLKARRAGRTVADLLSNEPATSIPAYASGIHIDQAARAIPKARAAGFTSFKLKVGFETHLEPAKVREIAGGLAHGERLFLDANQAWSVDEACTFVDTVSDLDVGWLEEPLPTWAPVDEWIQLANHGIDLAAGENISGHSDFRTAIDSGAIAYLQPDLAKWGGFSGCSAVAREAIEAGRTYCPHFLGGGLGLIGSAQLLAATGGPGLLEVDVNPNPLRDAFFDRALPVAQGQWQLSSGIGLGVTALPSDLEGLVTHHREETAG